MSQCSLSLYIYIVGTVSVTFGEKRKKKSKLSVVLDLCYLCYLILLTLMRMTMLALVYENSDGIWSIDS